ncbi:MAG: hypothetical protein HY332_04330, partial [Chloroflexi bacterium]|nr:hypothetical protein [Chloroflexota bacterium]
GGTWSESFRLEGWQNTLAPLTWWLALQALGLLAAPIIWRLFARVPDRGYGVSKALGLLGVSWLAWSLAGFRLLPWTRLTLLIAFAALAVASGLALRRWGAAWLAWVRAHARLVLAIEAVYLFAYILFVLIRMANPDLWHPARGGEKPMEFSYLNAVIKTAYFPPYDPWFAGGYLNYYYFGYVLVAALTKLTGTMPSIAFNLAIPALYALTAAGCFSFAYNLARLGGQPRFGFRPALAAGVAGFVLVAFAGNLDGLLQLLERLARAAQGPVAGGPSLGGVVGGIFAVLFGGRPLEPFDFWRSSRVIPNNTINEFPFWTFLFADLHAHLISIPFQVVTLGWLLNLAFSGRRSAVSAQYPGNGAADAQLTRTETDSAVWEVSGKGQSGALKESPVRWLWRTIGWGRVGEILFTAWLAGALYVINTWEFPTYLLLAAATFVIAEFTAQRGLTLAGLARASASAAAIFLLAKAFYRPFWNYFLTFYTAVTPWTTDKSRLDHYLIIHGVFIFLLGTFVLLLGVPAWRRTGWGRYLRARWRWLGDWERFSTIERLLVRNRRWPAAGYAVVLAVAVAVVVAFWLRGLPLIAFLSAMLAATIVASWERRDSPSLLFASLLAATGFAIGIFVEFFTLQGDIGRMNTVFKFYLQVWVMWGLVSAAALAWAVDRIFASRAAAQPAVAYAPTPAAHRGLLFDDPIAAGVGDGDGIEERSAVSGQRSAGGGQAAGTGEKLPLHLGEGPTSPPLPVWERGLGGEGNMPWYHWAWLAAAAALLLAALAFPLGGTPARLTDRFHPLPPALDGMAYMRYATIVDGSSEVAAANPGGAHLRASAEYDAIGWLLTNVPGSPVVLEASVPEYRWGSRIAKYTGLPAVLGWRWHQVQQRGTFAPQVDQRLRDVQTMFNDPSPRRVLPLLERYQVRYIYVGDLEKAYYAAAGLAKLDQMSELRPVYQQDGVTIYEVIAAVPSRSK